jgi:hypothetical protein
MRRGTQRDFASAERRDEFGDYQPRLGNRALGRALAGGGSIPTMTVPFVTALQRSAGNRAAQQLIGSARRVAPPPRDLSVSVQRYSIINPADYALGAGSRFSNQQLVIGAGTARYEQETRERGRSRPRSTPPVRAPGQPPPTGPRRWRRYRR